MKTKSVVPAFLAGLSLGALAYNSARNRQRRMDFKGKSVIIAGGSRGLGLILARKLAAEGAQLTLLARSVAELERVREELWASGSRVLAMTCDISVRDQVQAAVRRVVEEYGRIDVLVNAAGIIQVGPVDHMQITDYEHAMNTHFWGPLFTMEAVIPQMRMQGGGRIVNIASVAGRVAVPHLAPYNASKHALVGLSDTMRAELARDKIWVTTVTPGLMRTGSHVNGFFKGQNREEFAWFSIINALPLTSMDAERAAGQVIRAARYGKSARVLTWQARLMTLVNEAAPGLMAWAMRSMNRLLPSPVDERGNQVQTGWESQSLWAPSFLTRLSDDQIEPNNQMVGFEASVFGSLIENGQLPDETASHLHIPPPERDAAA